MPVFGCPAEDRGRGSHDKDASWRLLAIIWRGATILAILAAPAWRFFLLTNDDLKLRHAVPPESTAGTRMSICLFYSSWLAWTCFWIFFQHICKWADIDSLHWNLKTLSTQDLMPATGDLETSSSIIDKTFYVCTQIIRLSMPLLTCCI